MQIKNEFAKGFLRNFFPIMWKEILMKGYIVFREPYLFKAIFSLLSHMPSALKKRKYIMSRARMNWREMEKWLSGKKSKYS